MLQNTFCHISGITENTEKNLWKTNILSWNDFLEKHESIEMPKSKKQKVVSHIVEAQELIRNSDYSFFNTPTKHHWRLYNELKNSCCFLDIETTGLDKSNDIVTTVGLYDGKDGKVLVNGQDLDKFREEIKKYKLIITFNGACFDLPFLKNFFGMDFDHFHIDLRFLLKDLGYSGGLKKIERDFGLAREDEIGDVDGLEAVRLWYRYKKGDQEALETLKKYNLADVVNLKFLMEKAYEMKREKDFLEHID